MKNRIMAMTSLRRIEKKMGQVPEVSSGEILVRVENVGICGSDMHYFQYGKTGRYTAKLPFVLGHECAGTVVRTGSQAGSIAVGDRVALEPGIPCGKCEFCKSGRYNLCPEVRFLATPPYDGCLKDFITYPSNMAFQLPDCISTEEGALLEPLSVGIHASRQGEVGVGDTVIIAGCGCIGLMIMLACKCAGASRIIMLDTLEARLERAAGLGADEVFSVKNEDSFVRFLKTVNGCGADVVFEATANPDSIRSTVDYVKRGGKIVLVGVPGTTETAFNFQKVIQNEIQIRSVFRYRNIYPMAIQAVASGQIDLGGLVTDRFDFEQSEEAFLRAVDHKAETIKVMISNQGQ